MSRALAIVLILSVIYAGCDLFEPEYRGVTGQLAITLKIRGNEGSLLKTSGTTALDSVRCIIFQNEQQIQSIQLQKQDNQFAGEVDLIAGTGYHVLLYGKKDGLAAYRGEKQHISISAGKRTSVILDFINFQVILLSPNDTTFSTHARPAFTWENPASAEAFTIQIDDEINFATPLFSVDSLTTPSYSMQDSLPAGRYYWRVRALDYLEIPGAWSTANSFTVRKFSLTAPKIIEPVDGMVTEYYSMSFEWITVEGALRYHLQVGRSNDFSGMLTTNDSTLTGNFYGHNYYGDTFYWRIRAQDSEGTWSEWSKTRYFQIKRYLTERPWLSYPSDSSTVNTNQIFFSWSGLEWATSYTLEIYNDRSTKYNALVYTLSGTTKDDTTVSTGLSDGTYYWRVCGSDGADFGYWSNLYSFTLITAAGSVIFQDDFNRAEIGSNYEISKAAGWAKIIGYPPDGKLQLFDPDASGTETIALLKATGTSIKDFTLRFDFDNGDEQRQNNVSCIYFRYLDSNNTYFFLIFEDNVYAGTRQKLYLYRVLNGDSKLLLQKDNFLLNPGTYEITCSGNTITLKNYQGGTTIDLSVTDPDINREGFIGFRVNEETLTIDNLVLLVK